MIAFAGHWRSVTPKRSKDQGWHSPSAWEAAAEKHPECPGRDNVVVPELLNYIVNSWRVDF